jgi:hypothetical protein
MRHAKNKTTASFIALLLILTISVSFVAMPVGNAHTPPWVVPTWAYITASPNPVGVGQTALVFIWLDRIPPTASGVGGDRWRNLKIEVTKPDGNKETLGPLTSDPVGGTFTKYTPDQIGEYTFEFKFPGQVLSLYGPTGIAGSANAYENDTFQASSATMTLTVQQDPIPYPQEYPLPTEYWARPIEGENTAWATIGSNWLGSPQIAGSRADTTGIFQPDGTAPNTAHVMWTKPIMFGGVVGGSKTGVEDATFYTGKSYETKFDNPLIMYGRLYYNLPKSNLPSGNGYVCVDLRTGEDIFWQNMTAPSFGQLYDYESMNQHGVIANGYLWRTVGTTWYAYDPLDGNWLFTLTDVPSGVASYGPNGEILRYVLNPAGKWIALWNNTAEQQGLHGALGNGSSAYQWNPVGKTVNMSRAYSWNVTASGLPTGATVIGLIDDDLLLGTNGSLPGVGNWNPYTMWAISLKPNSRGQMLWMKNYDPPANNVTVIQGPVDREKRIFAMYYRETMQWSGYSMDTGSQLWGPVGNPTDFDFYSVIRVGGQIGVTAYGKLYMGGYAGALRCYDVTNGSLLWIYNNTYAGYTNSWGNYPIFPIAIADGKMYLYTNEHSPNAPLYKGSRIRCIDANTGKEIWTLLGWGATSFGIADHIIADGSLVYLNEYDMQIYCISKGPSAMTIDAPNTETKVGESLVIRGSVTDVAAGTRQTTQAARFPNGVPCVSDASMGQWMEYVYMDKPRPTNATGVPVTIDVIDANGNYRNIGQVDSDASGLYSLAWTPDIPGKYIVIATFAGSESYWPSNAQTAFVAAEVPPPPTAQPVATLPPTEIYIMGGVAAIIIAIAIVGALMLLAIRKRP